MARYDSELNAHLSEYGNRVLEDLWLRKGRPNKVVISHQQLECEGELRTQRYGSRNNPSYDGIHLRGQLGTQHMTKTFIQMLVQIYPHLDPNIGRKSQNKNIPPTHTVNNFPHNFGRTHF